MIYKCESCGKDIRTAKDLMICGICKKILDKKCFMKHFPCDDDSDVPEHVKEHGKEPWPDEER